MPYGVKRGLKAPGEFGAGDVAGFALAGATGIIAALVTDFNQKGEASALFTINQWVVSIGSLLGIGDIPLWVIALGMTVVGAGSIFYFQPITRQGAFAQGFGLLAVLMTTIPADLAGGLEPFVDPPSNLSDVAFRGEASSSKRILNVNAVESEASIVEVQESREARAARYDLHLRLNFEGGFGDDIEKMIRRGTIRGRLHNEETGETWNLFRTAGGTLREDGESLIVHAGGPARSDRARLWVRIECAGHTITQESKVAELGRPVEWEIEIKESTVPLFIQRLNQSYWF